MQFWRLFLLIVVIVLLLVGCNLYPNSQTVGAQAARLPVTPQNIAPTAIPKVSAAETPIVSADSGQVSNTPPDTCPVTRPPTPPFTPPPPYPRYAPASSEFWYGTDTLWTAVPGTGVWSALPHNPEGYTQKVFWWRKGYSWQDEPEPHLSVTGQRLDAPASPLSVSKATNAFAEDIGSAMLVGVDFPTLGCWEISGHYADAELSFVVWIAP